MEIRDPVISEEAMRDAIIDGFFRQQPYQSTKGNRAGYTRPPGTCAKNRARRKAERQRKKSGGQPCA
jgi:hypothetical protein